MRVIFLTDTVVEPLAVVIKLVTAPVTLFAMLGVRMRDHVTDAALIGEHLIKLFQKDFVFSVISLVVYERIC